jgi:hypothetical protein
VYASARIAARSRRLLLALARLEARLLRADLDDIAIVSPVYIAGLPRAGSTILLEVLASHPDVATHRYLDFPFVHIPYLWHTALGVLPRRTAVPYERPHGDGIRIAPESPEAMEEMLWMAFFPHLHDPSRSSVLDERTAHPAFECFYRDHIRTLLLARRRTRYVAKGHYNVSRLGYLHTLFPDARFVIPIREPVAHVQSLMRQHENFLEQTARDPRIRHVLRIAGHFEFGPDVRLINTGDGASAAPRLDARAWARYWNSLYRHVHETLSANPWLKEAALIVRHERLRATPTDILRQVLEFCQLPDPPALTARWAPRIAEPDPGRLETAGVDRETILHETREARELLGYA